MSIIHTSGPASHVEHQGLVQEWGRDIRVIKFYTILWFEGKWIKGKENKKEI